MALALDANNEAAAAALRESSLDCLAPLFRAAVVAAVADCQQAGAPVKVFETCRSDALQQLYYARGASHAASALFSWHGYGLAVDVIHPVYGWDLFPGCGKYEANPWWWHEVYETFQRHGLDSGADWHSLKDYPHWQWGRCRASPSDRARELMAEGGKFAVWKECGAIDPAPSDDGAEV